MRGPGTRARSLAGSECVVENRLFCPDWVADNWSGTLQPALVEQLRGGVDELGAARLRIQPRPPHPTNRPLADRPFHVPRGHQAASATPANLPGR